MEELSDFPFTGERRPFDWFLSEPPSSSQATHHLGEGDSNDLLICTYLYMAHRRVMYCNYMEGCKALFSIFFTSDHALRERCPHWSDDVTSILSLRSFEDWSPAYEIQRLWLVTGIHWSWLEWAWWHCESQVFLSQNLPLIKKLERQRWAG